MGLIWCMCVCVKHLQTSPEHKKHMSCPWKSYKVSSWCQRARLWATTAAVFFCVCFHVTRAHAHLSLCARSRGAYFYPPSVFLFILVYSATWKCRCAGWERLVSFIANMKKKAKLRKKWFNKNSWGHCGVSQPSFVHLWQRWSVEAGLSHCQLAASAVWKTLQQHIHHTLLCSRCMHTRARAWVKGFRGWKKLKEK